MSVSLDRNKNGSIRGHRYDFFRAGRRQRAPRAYGEGCICTGKQNERCPAYKAAAEAEVAQRDLLQRRVDGRALPAVTSPSLTNWACEYLDWAVKEKGVSPEGGVADSVRMVLRFFGRRPKHDLPANPFDTRGFKDLRPYHDLTLADLLTDPSWILRFEDHLERRGITGSTKNKYRNTLSQMFRLAMSPPHQHRTGVHRNPFAEIHRDAPVKRYTSFGDAASLDRVIQHSPPHLKLAIQIALYTVKLRRGNILNLEWSKGRNTTAWIDEAMQFMTDLNHKTQHHTGMPMVATISPQLRKILVAAKRRQDAVHARLEGRYGHRAPKSNHVIQWHGRPVTRIAKAFEAACLRAGVRYGLSGGVTFHSLRHESGTEMVFVPGLSDSMRQALMGHRTSAATQVYKQLVPEHEREAMNTLAKRTEQKLAKGRKVNLDSQRGEKRGDSPVKKGQHWSFRGQLDDTPKRRVSL